MNKPNHWKQDTPQEQAVVILGSIEGWLSNLEEGITPRERVLHHCREHLKDLRILCGINDKYEAAWIKDKW